MYQRVAEGRAEELEEWQIGRLADYGGRRMPPGQLFGLLNGERFFR